MGSGENTARSVQGRERTLRWGCSLCRKSAHLPPRGVSGLGSKPRNLRGETRARLLSPSDAKACPSSPDSTLQPQEVGLWADGAQTPRSCRYNGRETKARRRDALGGSENHPACLRIQRGSQESGVPYEILIPLLPCLQLITLSGRLLLSCVTTSPDYHYLAT